MKKILLLLSLLVGNLAYAGFLIEPYAGYGLGLSSDFKYNYIGTRITTTSDAGGKIEYGGRLGYTFAGAFIAFDYSMASFDIEESQKTVAGFAASDTTKRTQEVDETKMAIAFGYEFPVFLRAWAKYYFSADWEYTDNVSIPSTPFKTELSGSGFAFGAAYTGLPIINIYAEYQILTMDSLDKATNAGYSIKTNLDYYKRDVNYLVIGVSAPFDLM